MDITQPVHPDPLLEHLRLFTEAARALTRQWSLIENHGDHPIGDKYPFYESFAEIAQLINEWYQAALHYQPADYGNLLTTRAAQYNTTPEVVRRAVDAFWSTGTDIKTASDSREAHIAGASSLDEFIKYFAFQNTHR